MSEPIICPNCSNKIEISEAMSAQLAATIRHELQTDLEAEKRAFNRHWTKRQKQLDRALASTTGLYGHRQGIIGSSL